MKIPDLFRRKKPLNQPQSDLLTRFREAVSACRELEAYTGRTKIYLAGAYMRHILRESDEWKQEHAFVLFENFFIYDYLAEKGVIERKETQPMLLYPRCEARAGLCEIRTFSSVESSESGRIEIRSLCGVSPEKALWGLGFTREGEVYTSVVTDNDAPLGDRAAEAGAALIDHDVCLIVSSRPLYEKILARDFTPLNRYRVRAPENERELAFIYPWNPDLHRRLFRTGAKWNGQYMALPLTKAENALDIIKIYGFYVEPGAARRIDLWIKAERCARIMPKRRDVNEEEALLLESFFARPIDVLEDLKDE